MNKFYQFCFTRLGGNEAGAGWQSLNKSPDMPSELSSIADSAAAGNQIAQSDKTPDGVCMHQIYAGDAGIGNAYVNYAGRDFLGRGIYFSHAFLFENTYEVLKNPNNILAIDKSNYHFTPEETASVPGELAYSEPITEEKALALCNMTAESYVTFMKAIYRLFFETAKITIYVKTDGSDEMANALMYLAYSALPYSLRHRITAETYAKPKSSECCSIVFTDSIPERVKYIDPVTGTNNIIDAALEDWLSKYTFALYYVNAYPTSLAYKDAFFERIEDRLTKIGFAKTENNDLLNLAFKTATTKLDTLSNEELIKHFYEWLSLNLPINDYIVDRLCILMNMVTSRDITVNDMITEKIVDKISKSQSEKLTEAYLNYLNSFMGKLSADEAYKFMLIQRKDAVLFARLCSVIEKNEVGIKILMDYYLREANLLVSAEGTTYDSMEQFLVGIPENPVKLKIRQIFSGKCEAIALEKQKAGEDFYNVYSEYQTAFKKICEGIGVKYDTLVLEYDFAFRNSFKVERIEEYKKFYHMFLERYPAIQPSGDFIYAVTAVENRDKDAIITYLKNGCVFTQEIVLDEADVVIYSKNLLTYALHLGMEKDCRYILVWSHFARPLNIPLIDLLVENKVELVLNPDAMQEAISTDEFWQKTDNLENFFNTALEYINKHSDPEAVNKRVMDILRNEIKERKKSAKEELKEQRKAEKEQRKVEKTQNVAADNNGDKKKGGLFGSLFGGFGAKKKKAVDDPNDVGDNFSHLSDE